MLILCIFLSDIFHGEDKERMRVRFSRWSDDYGFMNDEENIVVETLVQTTLLMELLLPFLSELFNILSLSITSSHFQLNIHFWIQTSGEGENQCFWHTLITGGVCVTGIPLSRLQKQKAFSGVLGLWEVMESVIPNWSREVVNRGGQFFSQYFQ